MNVIVFDITNRLNRIIIICIVHRNSSSIKIVLYIAHKIVSVRSVPIVDFDCIINDEKAMHFTKVDGYSRKDSVAFTGLVYARATSYRYSFVSTCRVDGH